MSSNEFANKIKELTLEEVEYTEDFFNDTFGKNKLNSIATLKESSRTGQLRNISNQFADDDIDEQWLERDSEDSYDGQLAVDVFQTENSIIITSTVAGVRSEDLDIDMNGDMITIKGKRRHKFGEIPDGQYFIRECYWGGFSRSIILPVDIQHDNVSASLENGILTITLPKSQRSRNSKIEVVELNA